MKILSGLADGALLQRDKNGFCRCLFEAVCTGELKTSLGFLEKKDANQYVLKGIVSGGPYTLELSDDTEQIILSIWVGDLWILGGQSNMEGAGKYTIAEEEEERSSSDQIRCYYLDNRWAPAIPILHEPWLAVDDCQRKVWIEARKNSPWKSEQPAHISHGVPKSGVGPGLYFAKKLFEITGVPQAVIPCALGGANLDSWIPQEESGNNLYAAMLRRFIRTGSFVRGIFWDQGEAETSPNRARDFTSTMKTLFESMRRDMKDPNLPIVQVQLGLCGIAGICDKLMEGEGGLWNCIREKQRLLDGEIPYLETIASIDNEYDDLIHYSSASQRVMGKRAALSMALLCGYGGKAAPRIGKMEVRQDEYVPFFSAVDIYYENVEMLQSAGRPSGFLICEDIAKWHLNPNMGVSRIRMQGNVLTLYSELDRERLKDAYICYGYGHMSYCNIVDEQQCSIPAFGPARIRDFIKEK